MVMVFILHLLGIIECPKDFLLKTEISLLKKEEKR